MKKYVLVGLGVRSALYKEAIAKDFRENAKLVAICDKNIGRVRLSEKELSKFDSEIDCYHADDFSKMLQEHRPDVVIVCTVDRTHDDYICQSLKAGCDVITEKPMTIDEKRCQRIIDTVNETGKKVRITFNYRYSPPRSQVKEILMSGVIGRILSVDFNWMLDTYHGADYFRRWHSDKDNSGGLMVHKATHHFDLVNWWLSSYPESVFAKGKREFYAPKQAKLYGLKNHSERCLDCSVKHQCNYYLDMNNRGNLKALYLDNEKHDGYVRDRCVFSDKINIEDTMNVVVQYNNGVLLSYSLNAFCPWEGYKIAFNGTKGRLEHSCMESSYINGDGTVQGESIPDDTIIRICPHFKTPYSVEIREGKGGHGGGDILMLKDIFDPDGKDHLLRSADYTQGSYSIITGIAANKSMLTGREVIIGDLIKNLPSPVYPENSNEQEHIPFVPNAERKV